MRKIILVTNIPNNYRIPLFNELKEQLEQKGLELLVVFAAAGYSRRLAGIDMNECRFNYRLLHSAPIVLSEDNEKTTFSYRGLIPLLKKEKPYRIIVSGFSPATFRVMIASLLYNYQYIIWSGSIERKIHDPWYKKAWRKWLLSRSSAAVAYGTASKNYLTKLSPSKKISIAINTVDTAYFAEKVEAFRNHSNASTFIITYIGYLSRRKKVIELLHCIAELRKHTSGFQVDIVGDGEEKESLMQYTEANGLSAQVKFHGFRQKEELPEFLARTSIFAFQTGFDIWGLALNEAMAAGIPCLASVNAGAVHDLIEDGKTGYLVDFSETKSVASRMLWLLQNQDQAEMTGKNAAEFIRAHANLRVSAAGFIEAIDSTEM